MAARRPFKQSNGSRHPRREGREGRRDLVAQAVNAVALHHIIEALEPRTLLTHLVGGDIYEFQDANGTRMRVAMSGDVQADFVGAYVDDANTVIVNDIPGHFYESDTGRTGTDLLGGFGGADGCDPVNGVSSPTNITDPNFSLGSLARLGQQGDQDNPDINIEALASDSAGNTYGFNVGTVPDPAQQNVPPLDVLQVVKFDTTTGAGTVQATFQQGSLNEDVPATLSTPLAGGHDPAIDPTSPGLMYVLNLTVDPANPARTVSQLYRVNRFSGDTALVGTLRNLDTGATLAAQTMAFTPNGQLYALIGQSLVAVNKVTGAFSNADVIPLVNAPATPFRHMTYDEVDGVFYAITQTLTGTPPQLQVSSFLYTITVNGTPGVVNFIGEITVCAEAGNQVTHTDVRGIVFAKDAADNRILVALDIQTQQGGGGGQPNATSGPHLISMNPAAPGAAVPITEFGVVPGNLNGLTSVVEPGTTRPLIFATDGSRIIRGSPVTGRTDLTGKTIVTKTGGIKAADFDPATGLLYFVEEWTIPASQGQQTQTFDEMYTVNVNAGSRAAIQNSITLIPGHFAAATNSFTMHSIAFAPDGTLYGYATFRGQGAGVPNTLMTVNTTNTDLSVRGPEVAFPFFGNRQPRPINTIEGIEFDLSGEILTDPSRYLLAVTGPSALPGADRKVLRVELATGNAVTWGALPDAADIVSPIRGDDIQSLSWDPVFPNPFTGKLGALIATDETADEMVVIDARFRPAQMNIYSIYVTRADLNSTITIAEVVAPNAQNNNPRPMLPFTGDSGSVRMFPASGGTSILVTSDANTGAAFIGARLFPVPGTPNTGNEPVLAAPYLHIVGEQPATSVDLFGQATLRPGLQVTTSTLLDPLPTIFPPVPVALGTLGQNLDNIAAMAIAPNGAIVVIDTDHVLNTGVMAEQDEMAFVDGVTGQNTSRPSTRFPTNSPWQIYLKTTFQPLTNVQALAYGDVDHDGTAELYAIYNINGTSVLGQLIDNPDSSDFGAFIPIGSIGPVGSVTNVYAMAFANDGTTLYVIDNDNNLLRVNPNTGGILATIGVVNAAIGSMAFDASGQLLGFDVAGRHLVDIDVNTAAVGANVQTQFGSLPTSVGAIAFDRTGNGGKGRWLAVDNASSSTFLKGMEGASIESASLVVLRGTTPTAVTPQDLGRFLIGGTITGDVNITGSIDTFYAGWVITGNTEGLISNAPVTFPANFVVGGDARKVVSYTGFGGTPSGTYSSGFDMRVGGTVGLIRSNGSVYGPVDVGFSASAPVDTQYQTELEWRMGTGFISSALFTLGPPGTNTAFQEGQIDGDPIFNNDTFDTPEMLGTVPVSGAPNDPWQVSLRGNITSVTPPLAAEGPDNVDYFGIPVLAGQVITVQLLSDLGGLRVGVFDPEGRLIATDYNHTDPAAVANRPFQFRAAQPGIYRIAVSWSGNSAFADVVDTSIEGYFLSVSSLGALAIGALQAATNILPRNPTTLVSGTFFVSSLGPTVRAHQGDVGAIMAGGLLDVDLTVNLIPVSYVRANSGNIRVLQGGTISGDVVAPNGSIGRIDAAAALNNFNTGALSEPIFDPTGQLVTGTEPLLPTVGGDYQLIQSGATISGGLFAADRAIGVVRAASITGALSGPGDFRLLRGFVANADYQRSIIPVPVANYVLPTWNGAQDGTIDLIDAPTLAGAEMRTGPGGNVRYIRATTITRPAMFGGGTPEETDYGTGQSVTLTDDSGSLIDLVPQGVTANPAFNPADPLSQPLLGPALTAVLTYPVVGSGGAVLVSFTVDGPLEIVGRGTADDATAEIGLITANGPATALGADPITGKPVPGIPAAGAVPMNLAFSGSARIDVMELAGGSFDNIIDNTGEIIVANIGDVGLLRAGTLGVAGISHTGMAVEPQTVTANAFPFLNQHTGIVAGTIAIAESQRELGNFLLSGAIGTLTPNDNHQTDAGGFEGIVGPIQAAEMWDIDIADGLAPTGTGNFAHSGLFASGIIHSVRNRGLGSDIRGDIVSLDRIQSVVLHDGAIIGADIFASSSFADSLEFGLPALLTATPTPQNTPDFTIGEIRTTGTGGIIGTAISASNTGPVTAGGFGIFNCLWWDAGRSIVSNIVAGGYGIRGSNLGNGASNYAIVADGNGAEVPTNAFTPSVRPSEMYQFEPLSLQMPNRANDLHAYLGTSAAVPLIPGVTTTGVIENTAAGGSRDLKRVQAFQIRSTNPTNVLPPFAHDVTQATSFSFANSIGSIATTSTINGMNVTTGKLTTFQPGGDVFQAKMTVAGPLKTLKINGSLAGNSDIRAIGPNGRIDTVTVRDDLNGSLQSTGPMKKITVGRNIAGTIGTLGNVRSGTSIGSLFFGGQLSGNLTLNGNIGTVTTGSSLTASNSALTVNGSMQKLQVRGNLGTNVNVTDSLKLLDVWGSILTGANIHANNVFGTLQVAGDTQPDSVISARVLGKVKVKGLNNATYRIG